MNEFTEFTSRGSQFYRMPKWVASLMILAGLFIVGCGAETSVASKEGEETLAATAAAEAAAAATDTDGDGIADTTDACDTEKPSVDVDENGCEDDTDDDGVDDVDEADTDGDGIIDDDEVDTDGDGVNDDDEVDSDFDGLIDDDDSCPDEAPTTDGDADGCEDENTAPEDISLCISAQDSYDFDEAGGGYSEGATATRITFDGVDGVEYYVVKLLLENNEEGDDDRYLYAFIDINNDEWSEVNFEYDASEIEDSFAWETEYEWSEGYYIDSGYYYCSITDSSATITCYFDTLVSDSINTGLDSESNMVAYIAGAESNGDIITDWTEYGTIESIGASDELDGLSSCFEDNEQPVAVDFCMSDEDSYDEVDGDASGYSDLYTATRISFDGVEGVDFYVVKLSLANNASGDSDRYMYYLINIDDTGWADTYYDYDSSAIDEDFVWVVNSSPQYHYCSYSDAGLTISCYFDTAVFDSRDSGNDNESNMYAYVAAANSEIEIVSDWTYFGYIDSPATLKDCSE